MLFFFCGLVVIVMAWMWWMFQPRCKICGSKIRWKRIVIDRGEDGLEILHVCCGRIWLPEDKT